MPMQPRLGRPPKYDWATWMDGKEHTLREGADFDCTIESFGVLVRRQARITGRKVHAWRLTVTAKDPLLIASGLKPGEYIRFYFEPEAGSDAPNEQTA